MKENRKLKINGTILEKSQLENYLEKIASSHNTTSKSQKDTYPIPQMLENYRTIKEVYNLLNEHLNTHTSSRRMAIRQFLYNRRNSKTNSKRTNIKKIYKLCRNIKWRI